jgi:hypothetical protein
MRFKTFDIRDSAVQLFVLMAAGFTAAAVAGAIAIRGMENWVPPLIVLASTWVAACYIVYRFFRLRQDYKDSIVGYSALFDFEISRDSQKTGILPFFYDIDKVEAEVATWFRDNYHVPNPFGPKYKKKKIRFVTDPIPRINGGTARGTCDGTEILIHKKQETYEAVISTLGHELGHFVLLQNFPQLPDDEHAHHDWMKAHKFPYA